MWADVAPKRTFSVSLYSPGLKGRKRRPIPEVQGIWLNVVFVLNSVKRLPTQRFSGGLCSRRCDMLFGTAFAVIPVDTKTRECHDEAREKRNAEM